jgi:phosphomethylpyrimidine synthase
MTDKNMLEQVLKTEPISPAVLAANLAAGTLVVVKNRLHRIAPLAIGTGVRTKINANIGTSPEACDLSVEMDKLKICVQYGAHTVMDLSTGGNLDGIRKTILLESPLPVGTVPIYQVMVDRQRKQQPPLDMTADELFDAIEKHCADGVDFVTVHCGVTRRIVEILDRKQRLIDVVSRGGSYLVKWMREQQQENPLFEQYDRLLSIAKKYDVALSLGDGLRPGCLADATDHAQVEELYTLGGLVDRARTAGVAVIVEGPGHVPLDQVVANVSLQKRVCHGAPFYVLGPLVTDISIGYDHIAGAIGGAVAAAAGADFLCYVTPAEHLRLPTLEDVREGVVASKIAAHAADIAKGLAGARAQDDEISRMKKEFNWERIFDLCVDPVKARQYRKSVPVNDQKHCSMCGEFCAMRESKGRQRLQ